MKKYYKKLLFLILAAFYTANVFAQDPTNVPDNNFEYYLETHNADGNEVQLGDPTSMGDGVLNNSTLKSKVENVANLNVNSRNISNLQGIEAFTNLEELDCHNNNLTNIDLGSNTSLKKLVCNNNVLTSLNVQNGNNANIIDFNVTNNPDLGCIQLDTDILFLIPLNWMKDEIAVYSENCDGVQTGWGIAGSSTPNGWNGPDVPFNETEVEKVYEGIITLQDGLIKFRRNNNWAENYGDELNDGTLESGGPDIAVSAGKYEIVMNLNDFTYSITPYIPTLGIVGSATPNRWDGPDIEMEYNVTSSLYSGNVTLTDGLIKFREDNDWSVNYGDDGADGTLEQNGANIAVTAGYYFITVDTNNLDYSIQPLVSIPDPNFEQALIDLGIDSDGVVNESILKSDVENVTQLNLSDPQNNSSLPNVYGEIQDLTGIEAFNSLDNLNINTNDIAELDLSENLALRTLYAADNSFSTINLESNVNLITLLLQGANIESIDLTKNINLGIIQIAYTNITEIDLSNNLVLAWANLFNNNLSTVDLSNNKQLSQIWVSNNKLESIVLPVTGEPQSLTLNDNLLTELDLSSHPNITIVNIKNNLLNTLNLKNGNSQSITYLAADNNPNLDCIQVDDGIAGTAPVGWTKDGFAIYSSDCATKPEYVYIPDPNFEQSLIDLGIDSDGVVNTSILTADAEVVTGRLGISGKEIADLTGIEAFVNITELQAGANLLTEIDVSQNTELLKIWLYSNQLISLDLSNNTKIQRISAGGNQLSELDVSNLPDVHTILAWQNQLASINVSNNPQLTLIQLQDNLLESIDLSNTPILNHLNIGNNLLTIIDLSQSQNLEFLLLNNNQLTQLDISALNAIDRVVASGNLGLKLITTPITGSPTLTFLNLSGTGLSNFNPTLYPNLEYLWLNENSISKFNTNNIPNLKALVMNDNQLDALDLSSNTLLQEVQLNNNLLTDLDIRNGNNTAIIKFKTLGNMLTCISVDNPADATLPYSSWSMDSGIILSANCKTEPEVVLIPDANFELALAAYDTNGMNGNILLSEAEAIVSLDVNGNSILDLTGIEAFVNLTDLNVSNNLLNSINLAENTNLVNVNVSDNILSDILVFSGRSLISLDGSNNQITTLTLESFTNLESLVISYNLLNELDLRNNAALTALNATNNSNLFCIGVIDPSNIPIGWVKDNSASYSNNPDCIAPAIVSKPVTIFLDNKGAATVTDRAFDNGSYDNVTQNTDLLFNVSKTSFNCSNLGLNNLTLTVIDAAGNSSTQPVQLTVIDNIKPTVATIKSFSHDLKGNAAFNLSSSQIVKNSGDNCGAPTLSVSPSLFTAVGDYTVTLKATDSSGKFSEATMVISITNSAPSGSASLSFKKNLTLTLFPVPFSNVININFSKTTALITVSVVLRDFNMNPTGILFTPNSGNLISGSTSHLQAGIYILQVTVGTEAKTATLVKN